ncbi:hypothetical protein Tco_0605735 [Tanacetum coccineum]
MNHFGGDNNGLRRGIVEGIIDLLDTHNELVQLFRTAHEKYEDIHIPNFKVRLYNVISAQECELPTGDMLGTIVYETGLESGMDYDIVLEERSGADDGWCYWLLLLTEAGNYEKLIIHTILMTNRIDYIREHQNNIKNEYLSGIYDAINQGDIDGFDCGARLILP